MNGDRLLVIINSMNMQSRLRIYKFFSIHFSQQCMKHSMQYYLFPWKGSIKNRSQDTNCQDEGYKHSRSSSDDGNNETALLLILSSAEKVWILTLALSSSSPIAMFYMVLGESLKLSVIWLTAILSWLSSQTYYKVQ